MPDKMVRFINAAESLLEFGGVLLTGILLGVSMTRNHSAMFLWTQLALLSPMWYWGFKKVLA